MPAISNAPTKKRFSSRSLNTEVAVKVDPVGGDFGAGLIRGVSIITKGEAFGHKLFIDDVFLDSVNAAGGELPNGLKSKFTHTGLSADGLGKALGRFKNFSRNAETGQVLADLHLLKTADTSPDGKLATHILSLAEEAPDMLGASIVFSEDEEAQEQFQQANLGKGDRFVSPDKDNQRNLTHVRLETLSSSDIVGDPAANPNGMFATGFIEGSEIPAAAESLLSFALGLSDLSETEPTELQTGIHPERVKIFLQGFLERHGLQISPKEESQNLKVIEIRGDKTEERLNDIENEQRRLTADVEILKRRVS